MMRLQPAISASGRRSDAAQQPAFAHLAPADVRLGEMPALLPCYQQLTEATADSGGDIVAEVAAMEESETTRCDKVTVSGRVQSLN